MVEEGRERMENDIFQSLERDAIDQFKRICNQELKRKYMYIWVILKYVFRSLSYPLKEMLGMKKHLGTALQKVRFQNTDGLQD